MNDFKINMYKLVLVQKYGNKSQMSWEHNTRTFSVQASCGLSSDFAKPWMGINPKDSSDCTTTLHKIGLKR